MSNEKIACRKWLAIFSVHTQNPTEKCTTRKLISNFSTYRAFWHFHYCTSFFFFYESNRKWHTKSIAATMYRRIFYFYFVSIFSMLFVSICNRNSKLPLNFPLKCRCCCSFFLLSFGINSCFFLLSTFQSFCLPSHKTPKKIKFNYQIV